MCDHTPSPLSIKQGSIKRRSLLRAVAAGTGVAIAGSIAAAAPTEGLTPGTPVTPLLPLLPAQPQGTVLTLLGTAGAPQAEYVRTGTSSVLTVEGYGVDAGRSSVTQYLNSGMFFSKLSAMFITHLHSDHLADYYYFLLEGGQPNAEGDRLDLSKPLPVFGPGSAGALPSTSSCPASPLSTGSPHSDPGMANQ